MTTLEAGQPLTSGLLSEMFITDQRNYDRLWEKPRGLVFYKVLSGDCQFGKPGRVLVETDPGAAANASKPSAVAGADVFKFTLALEADRYYRAEFSWPNIYVSDPAIARNTASVSIFKDGKQIQKARTTNSEGETTLYPFNHDGSGKMFVIFKSESVEKKHQLSVFVEGGSTSKVFKVKKGAFFALYDMGAVNRKEIT